MYDFILQLFFLGSLSIIVYMMARALPRVAHHSQRPTVYDRVDRLLSRLPLHHIDERLVTAWEKWLRRARVVVMKTDNLLLQKLSNIKRNNGQQNSPVQELLEHINSDRIEQK